MVHTIHKHLSTSKLLSPAAWCGVVWQTGIYTKQCGITYQMTVSFGVTAVRTSKFTYLHLITVTVTDTTLHKFTFTIQNSSQELQLHVYKDMFQWHMWHDKVLFPHVCLCSGIEKYGHVASSGNQTLFLVPPPSKFWHSHLATVHNLGQDIWSQALIT